MKLRQHATRCSLCSAHYGVRHNTEHVFLVYKSFAHFSWPLRYRLQDVNRVPWCFFLFVLYRSGASFLHFFIGPRGNWPASTRFILQRFLAIFKTRDPSEACTTHSFITVYIFQVIVHFSGSFPRFKAKFNYGTLLHVDTFDPRNKHTLNLDGDKTTAADAVETSPCSFSGKNDTILRICRTFRK